MITSSQCYLREKCWKYNNSSKECSNSDIFCPKLFRINCLFDESLLSMKQRKRIDLRLEEDSPDMSAFQFLHKIEESIDKFVDVGENLYLFSLTCGNGKTAWATRLLQSYVNKIWHKSDLTCKILFISVPRYLLALKDTIANRDTYTECVDYVEHIKKNITTADLVVFDEIGTKEFSAFDHENILNLVNTRIDLNKSNIYTSNLPKEVLREKVGERLYSRIIGLSTVIELRGCDKRPLRDM